MARILAVDDVPENVYLLQGDLEEEGHEVSVATDGEAALESVANNSPDLVLLDINMPGMSGLKVCEALKSNDATKDIPIILLSINSLDDDIVCGLDQGAHDYVVKPYQFEILMARVRSALRLKQTQDELAVAYARLEEVNGNLETLATVDQLTALANRRYFLESMNVELGRAWRYKSEVSLLMIDVDYFKSINDQYGHLCGDFVLKKVAESFLKVVRSVDLVGRVGGEEFAVCCPKVSVDEVALLGERIRSAIESLTVDWEGNTISVTVSIGATEMAPNDHQANDLYRRADAALYQAKEKGRNRVVKASIQSMN